LVRTIFIFSCPSSIFPRHWQWPENQILIPDWIYFHSFMRPFLGFFIIMILRMHGDTRNPTILASPVAPLFSSTPLEEGSQKEKPPLVHQTHVLGGRQQNYAFSSSVDPKLVKSDPSKNLIAVVSGHCRIWFQYAPPCNLRLAVYDATTLDPIRLFDLLAGPLVEDLAFHPTKPFIALATSIVRVDPNLPSPPRLPPPHTHTHTHTTRLVRQLG